MLCTDQLFLFHFLKSEDVYFHIKVINSIVFVSSIIQYSYDVCTCMHAVLPIQTVIYLLDLVILWHSGLLLNCKRSCLCAPESKQNSNDWE